MGSWVSGRDMDALLRLLGGGQEVFAVVGCGEQLFYIQLYGAAGVFADLSVRPDITRWDMGEEPLASLVQALRNVGEELGKLQAVNRKSR